MNIDVYISNISEDVWDFITTLKEEEKKFEIEENAYLSDREILTLNPKADSVIIFPETIDPAFIAYYQELFSNTAITVLVPASHSGEICKDIQNDQKVWDHLLKLGAKNTLVLKSYSSSKQFFELLAALRNAGLTVSIPESPLSGTEEIVDYYGSKSGIRETVTALSAQSKLGSKWIADGEIAHTKEQAIQLATTMYRERGGVVIKTNKAHSGAGVVIIPPKSITEDISEHFKQLFNQEEYWSKFPIIVEEFLAVDASVGGGNPNCEYRIDDSGNLELLFICGMRITAEGVFKGVEINNHVFDEAITNRLIHYGESLGEVYKKAGYRGYFDVDCMYTKDQQLLITESNVRKTGGTHVYHTGTLLLGPNYCEDYYLLSNNSHPLSEGKKYTFKDLLDRLKPILFSKDKKEGVILASSNILKQGKLSHIIIGKNKQTAYEYEAEMERLLQ
ncbi:MAG: hypothetical protein QG639_948 [Patescibacteria group bacterium]|nr:hypothetical protein [Patescibacteria group bacterium]